MKISTEQLPQEPEDILVALQAAIESDVTPLADTREEFIEAMQGMRRNIRRPEDIPPEFRKKPV